MTENGLSLIFISHKLHEVMSASDRVVVLRRGRVVAERRTAETSKEELAELMVGRKVQRPERPPATPGKVLLEGVDLALGGKGGASLHGVSFRLRAGETLGIIGVSGNGQATLAHLVSGLVAPDAGGLSVLGEKTSTLSPRDLVRRGVGRIPEDRNTEGAIGELAIWENAILERVRDAPFSKGGFVRQSTARAFAADVIDRFDIRGGSADSRTRLLSGGNMQKLIFGRNLAGSPRVLVAAQPTRGLDEGAIAAVHGEILAARDAGAGVLLISEDLDEVLALADRVQAIVGGRLSEPVPIESLDARRLGLMMAGEWAVASHEAA